MGDSFRQEIKFSAEEQNTCSIFAEGSESSGLGFDALNATVEAFAHGVGDRVAEVSEEVVQMTLKHLRNFDDRLELATCRPAIQASEKLAGVRRILVFPTELIKSVCAAPYLNRATSDWNAYKITEEPELATFIFKH